jgi:hypothetical protein
MATTSVKGGPKRSFVHDYFDDPEGTDTNGVKKRKCKKCSFTCVPKNGSTSSMLFHLQHSHGISRPDPDENDEKDDASSSGNIVKKKSVIVKPSVASFCASKNKSGEEWLTRQVVLDGLTLRQLAQSEFQEAACIAMRMKHYKSHVTVGKVVKDYIKNMKEKTKEKLTEDFLAGKRFSVIADEWTSVSNKRYLNVIIKSDQDTHNLGLVRCKGSVTSKVTADMVKVSNYNPIIYLYRYIPL